MYTIPTKRAKKGEGTQKPATVPYKEPTYSTNSNNDKELSLIVDIQSYLITKKVQERIFNCLV